MQLKLRAYLLLLGLGVAWNAESASPDFGPGVPYSTSRGPFAVEMGDFDEDGLIDALTADEYENWVSLHLNDGSGGFQAATRFAVGAHPRSLVVADFNHDGHLDFAAGNFHESSNSVSVAMGDGRGSFAAARSYAVGQNPMSLAVADLNGDGHPDLASGSNGYVIVLLGDGSGSFAALPGQPSNAANARLRSGDLNGDGHIDLLFGGTAVAVGLGDGTGRITISHYFQVLGVEDTVLGDLNDDGILDIAAATTSDPTIRIYFGLGDGTFSGGLGYSVPMPSLGSIHSLGIADVNNDGIQDVVAGAGVNYSWVGGSSGEIYTSVLMGQSGGNFEASPLFYVGGESGFPYPYGLAISDVDKDGLRDLLLTHQGGSKLFLVRNLSTPSAWNDGPVCPGQTLHLFASFGVGATYSWTGPGGFSSALQNPEIPDVSTAAAGAYSVTASYGDWTSLPSSTDVVVIEPLPIPLASNDGPKCEGASITLSTPEVPGATYSWTGPNGFSSTAREPTLSPATRLMSGDYSVSVSRGCGASAPGKTAVVVGPFPATPAISVASSVQSGTVHSAEIPGVSGATYSWSISNGTILSGEHDRIVTFKAGGVGVLKLFVTVTSWIGCVSGTGQAAVGVTPRTGLFYVLAPCREIDTRSISSPALGPIETRSFGMAGGLCGIPSAAKAIALNVTVVSPGATGYLTLFPGNQSLPLASAVSFSSGRTRASNGIYKVGVDGSLNIYNASGGSAHVIVDVVGYFD